MKNKIIFLSMLFLICLSNVKAYTTTGDKCINDGTCLVLCNYTNIEKSSSSVNRAIYSKTYDSYIIKEYITIYYDLKDEQFAVGFWGGGTAAGQSPYLKKEQDFGKVFSTQGTNVFIQPDNNFWADTFTCPAHGYYDMNSFNGGNEVCFDNDGKYCANKSNVGTTFSSKASDFISDTRDMTFEEELNNYFNNWSLGDITIDDFISGKYKTVDDILNKIVLTDLKQNYLKGYGLPDFMKSSSAYQNGVSKIKKNYEAMLSKWKEQLDIRKNDGVISDEQYNSIKDKLNIVGTKIEEKGQEYLDNIDTIKNETNPLKIVNVNICSPVDEDGNPNYSLLVFQVIGYIIMIIKILVPIILIVLGSIDLGKASLSGDDKALKEATVIFGKRVLIGLIIFFIPTVLDFFLGLVEGTTDVSNKYQGCTDCILNPNNSSKCSPKKLSDGTTTEKDKAKSKSENTSENTTSTEKNKTKTKSEKGGGGHGRSGTF